MQTTFERFSRRARRVLSLAQSEVQRLNHRLVEPEHLLMGLTQLDDGAAIEILRRVDVHLDQIRMQIEQLVGYGSEPTSDKIALAPRTKRVIAVAIAEADRPGNLLIGTQHLLLGLLQEGEGIAFEVLTESGVTIANARAQMPQSTKDEQKLRAAVIKQPAFEALTDREREILTMRFGLMGGQGHTLQEVAQALGATREDIRQIEAKALRTLRAVPEDDLRDVLNS